MYIPDSKKDLKILAQEVIEVCQNSIGQRQARCREYRQWIETGRASGVKSLHNRLYAHTDRLQSYLFSPTDLQFTIDFDNYYPQEVLLQAEVGARILSRAWKKESIDMVFAEGVKTSLDYGACIIKGLANRTSKSVDMTSRLVMPWMFGVYQENVNNLNEQEAVCEVAYLTLPQAWRRVAHLPNAEELYRKIKASAAPNTDQISSYFHQVLSTSQLQTGGLSGSTSPLPGGIVSLSNNPSNVIMDADLGAEVVKFYELSIWDDETADYVTVQMFDPDILVAPLFKKSNLFCPGVLQYELIQANTAASYIWGRSEITDMVEPQGLLSTWLDDVRRLMGVQYDKLIAFIGNNGITDEIYDQFRSNGFLDLQAGSDVKDLTPALPPQALDCIRMIIQFMDEVAGFGNILSGQGEAGVRAGNHASSLMRTASPRLRDRSTLVERQCASFADKIFSCMQAKSSKVYWVDPTNGTVNDFLLSQLPDDRCVSVDSHSSSPIYEQDHKELVAFLMKAGVIGGDSSLDLLPVPMRDLLKNRYKKLQDQRAAAAQAEQQAKAGAAQ